MRSLLGRESKEDPLRSPLQNYGNVLVGADNPLHFPERFRLVRLEEYFASHKFPGVCQPRTCDFYFALISGEPHVHFDGLGQVIDRIVFRKIELVHVGLAAGVFELKRQAARFSFERQGLFPHHSRADQHQWAADLGVAGVRQLDDDLEILLGLVELLNVSIFQIEAFQGAAESALQVLRPLLLTCLH